MVGVGGQSVCERLSRWGPVEEEKSNRGPGPQTSQVRPATGRSGKVSTRVPEARESSEERRRLGLRSAGRQRTGRGSNRRPWPAVGVRGYGKGALVIVDYFISGGEKTGSR